MPIKVQNELPARAILESENIFVMDEKKSAESGYPSASAGDSEFNALKGGNRAADFKGFVQYASAGGLYLFDAFYLCIQEYVSQPY